MKNQKLIDFLNQVLSNHFVMYVKLHRYHWYIKGPHFYQLHETFKDMYTKIALSLDQVAERILMIEGQPLATMSKYLKEATLVEASADDLEEEIIEQLLNDYQQIVNEIKQHGISLAKQNKDEPTLDLLVKLQSDYEKYNWMLAAYQK